MLCSLKLAISKVVHNIIVGLRNTVRGVDAKSTCQTLGFHRRYFICDIISSRGADHNAVCNINAELNYVPQNKVVDNLQ